MITVFVFAIALILISFIGTDTQNQDADSVSVGSSAVQETVPAGASYARDVLDSLSVKGRAPKTDYSRDQFGSDWATIAGCDMRNIILYRDLQNVNVGEDCAVEAGLLRDPYTGTTIDFVRGPGTSSAVQIDHVVALSDAWQKGAQLLSYEQRVALANDPLELLAVDGEANQQKLDGDAATWLPEYKPFRCQYVARQVAIKQKYNLWVTTAEYDAIKDVLQTCPLQTVPSE